MASGLVVNIKACALKRRDDLRCFEDGNASHALVG